MTSPASPRPDAGGRSTVRGSRGIVACEHPQAAVAGIRVLDEGGTAADACVAMAAAMAVLSPMMTGPGGDAFALFYSADTGAVSGLNGSGRAPGAATIDAVRGRGNRTMPSTGGLPITVPGAVRAWEDLAAAFGRLPLARLLAPACELAEGGFPVADVTARYWADAEGLLARDPAAAAAFLPTGRAPRAGEVIRLPDLAATLAAVAADGADAFYSGSVGGRIAGAAQAAGGLLEADDLAAHRSSWVTPIATTYRGLAVHEIPPPTQGIAALEMLNILAGFDLAGLDPRGAERIHLEAEAKKLAFEDLDAFVGDPDFVAVPTERLLSPEHAVRRRAELSRERARPGPALAVGGDTTYLCAVDAAGNGCSFINSLYTSFGSGVVAPGTGVCLQNRGVAFRLEPGHPAALAPRKRPRHTIIPGLATEGGRLWATFGVMGGFMQPQGHVQLLVNLRDFGMAPQEAVDHPRHFHDEGTLLVEGRVSEAELDRLRRRGHRVVAAPAYTVPAGGAQVISVREDGVRAAGSDPRKDGCALAQ